VQCGNMSAGRQFKFTVPETRFPVLYRFRDREEKLEPALDTLIVEPDQRRFMLVWRTKVALGRKLNALREIRIGHPKRISFRRGASGKPRFKNLSDLIASKKQRQVRR